MKQSPWSKESYTYEQTNGVRVQVAYALRVRDSFHYDDAGDTKCCAAGVGHGGAGQGA